MRESTRDLICRLEVSPVRGPTGASVHLLTRASGEPEILALADTVGEVVLVDPRGTFRTEQAQPDIAGVAVMKRGQSTMLALAEPEGVTLITEQDGRRLVDRLGCHEGRSTSVALFGADGEPCWIVSGDERGNLLRWEIPGRTAPIRRRIHRKSVSRLVATRLADGRESFLTASDDREVLIHTVTGGEPLARFSAHAGWIEQMVPLTQSATLWGIAVVDRVGLTIWEAGTGLAAGRLSGKSTADIAANWHPATGTLVAFTTPDAVALWSQLGVRFIRQPIRNTIKATAISVDPRGRTSILGAAGDVILRAEVGGEFGETGVRFPSPILRWHPWCRSGGALVVLEDGSLWNTAW